MSCNKSHRENKQCYNMQNALSFRWQVHLTFIFTLNEFTEFNYLPIHKEHVTGNMPVSFTMVKWGSNN